VTFVCSISLIVALLTASLLPTDVILVSFMKNPNGTFKVKRRIKFNRMNCGKYFLGMDTKSNNARSYSEICGNWIL
jgi:hypothetical protein